MANTMTPNEYDYASEDNPEEVVEGNLVYSQEDSRNEATEEQAFACSPAPAVEIKLFIARIPKTYEEEDIKKMFEEFGTVKSVIVIRDKGTNAHKNCAFVKMASICQADAAIRSMNNQCVVDSTMGPVQIRYATGESDRLGFTHTVGQPGVDEAKLFVGSLPKTIKEETLQEMFNKYGVPLDVFVLKDLTSGGNKGCGFVKMKYKEQALYAITELNGKVTLEGSTRPMEVRFAINKSTPGVPSQEGYDTYRWKRGRAPMSNHPPPSNPPPNGGKRGRYGSSKGGYENYNNGNPRQAGPWREYISPDGRFYYYNMEVGTTQWQVPKEFLSMGSRPYPPEGHGYGYNSHHSSHHGQHYGPGSQPDDESSLFIFHVPYQWNNNDLFRTFSPFGRVINAKIAFDRGTNRSKGYAFVSYDNPESATQAVANMNGFSILGKKLKVSVKTNRSSPY